MAALNAISHPARSKDFTTTARTRRALITQSAWQSMAAGRARSLASTRGLGKIDELSPVAPSWNKHWHPPLIRAIGLTKFVDDAALLCACEQDILDYDHGKQRDREYRWPMHDALTKEGDKQAQVLRMPHNAVQAVDD
jgi:hypothetical protein